MDDARECAHVGVDFLSLFLYEGFSMWLAGTINDEDAIPRSRTHLSDFRRTLYKTCHHNMASKEEDGNDQRGFEVEICREMRKVNVAPAKDKDQIKLK
jgi:activator of HSP90 ATPase